jgi:two-component system chemotaxis response regulator CheY
MNINKTILVVDDFESIREFVCIMLQRRGFATRSAAGGDEAYQILIQEADEISLVLTDFNMPHCSGQELLERIKGDPAITQIPVIFLTAEDDPEKIRIARRAGLAAWIKKPYRSEYFYGQIERAINSGRQPSSCPIDAKKAQLNAMPSSV